MTSLGTLSLILVFNAKANFIYRFNFKKFMAIITTATYPFFLAVLMAGIGFLVYSIAKDLIEKMQELDPKPETEIEPSFEQMSPEEKVHLQAQQRAEKVRREIMSEQQRKASVKDMMDSQFGDPRPELEPEPEPPKKWWQF